METTYTLEDLAYIDLNPQHDQPILTFRSNCEFKGLNPVPKRNKITLSYSKMKTRPMQYARQYGLWHWVNIKPEHREYLMSMNVSDVARLQMQLLLYKRKKAHA